MIGQKLVMALLAAGAVCGFAHGFASVHRYHQWREQQQQATMHAFAKACVDAAGSRH